MVVIGGGVVDGVPEEPREGPLCREEIGGRRDKGELSRPGAAD